MYTEYIIKKNGSNTENYYIENSCIYMRYLENGVWSERKAVVENVKNEFSVNVLNDETTIIFCRKVTGEIITAINNGDGQWDYKHILKQYQGNEIKAFVCGNSNETRLVYNVQTEGRNVLISQMLSENGKWGMGERIDDTMGKGIFDVRYENDAIVVFYEKIDGVFGYRIIKNGYTGGFVDLNRISPFISDISYMYDKTDVHILYAVKSMLSGHLYYKKKSADGNEKLTILYEGIVKKCCLYKVNGIIYFLWCVGEKIYIRYSSDNGENFSKTVKLRDEYKNKAAVIVYSKDVCAYEVFVNNKGIVHLNEVYSDIANGGRIEKSTVNAAENREENCIYTMKYKNQIDMLTQANMEKDRQIAELTRRLAGKNRENFENEVNLIKELQKLKNENEELRKKIEEKDEKPEE